MKRFATVVSLALVSACAGQGHAPQTDVAPVAGPPAPAVTRSSPVARIDTARRSADHIVVPPAPAVDTRIDAEVAAELKVTADSAADAEMLEKLDASHPTGKDDALPDADAPTPGGGVTWDIDFASFNNHDRVQ